ncbi:MAG: metallophosphoesterase [Acetobacteraceae bacterium]|nr:metallophosphoesterase [Acetobacteraceae bacterium]
MRFVDWLAQEHARHPGYADLDLLNALAMTHRETLAKAPDEIAELQRLLPDGVPPAGVPAGPLDADPRRAILSRLAARWQEEMRRPDAGYRPGEPARRISAPVSWLTAGIYGSLAFILISAVGVLLFHGNGFGDEDGLRGLVSFFIAAGTITIALALLAAALTLDRQDFAERFRQGKDVLTALVGILGTIAGFYFGLGEPHRNAPAAPGTRVISEAPTPGADQGGASRPPGGADGSRTPADGPRPTVVTCQTAPCPPAAPVIVNAAPAVPPGIINTATPAAATQVPSAPISVPTAAPAIEAAWVQLIPLDAGCAGPLCDAQALLRIVVPRGVACDSGIARDAGRSGAPLRLRDRPNSWPDLFPIAVCEIGLPLEHPGARLPDGTHLTWRHLAQGTPRAIAILGDTGCDNKDSRQARCDETSWPLARIAEQAATLGESGPDLVLHVGDYRYRGGDDWQNWRRDVFEPMRPLLLAAPWVMVRGNHENCYRRTPEDRGTGYGWALLLAPFPGETRPCPFTPTGEAFTLEPPHALDLGALRLVVLDSADARYRCTLWADRFRQAHLQTFEAMLRQPAREVWLTTHYAVFDAAMRPDQQCGGDRPQPAAYRDLIAPAVALANVRTVISGDLHSFRVARAMPDEHGATVLQFVAGHGGVALDRPTEALPPDEPGTLPGAFCTGAIGQTAAGPAFGILTRVRLVHGHLAARRHPDRGWSIGLRTTTQAGTTREPDYVLSGAAEDASLWPNAASLADRKSCIDLLAY